jgi:hypothetical protein
MIKKMTSGEDNKGEFWEDPKEYVSRNGFYLTFNVLTLWNWIKKWLV